MKKLVDSGTLSVAILALALSTFSFVSENKRAESIAQREEARAQAQVKPFLYIIERRYDAGFGIRIRNVGVGPAFISEAVFEKNGIKTNDLRDLFPGIDSDEWDDYVSLPQGSILEAGKSWDLVKLSNLDLKSKYLQLEKEIKFKIQYKDIYGNEIEPASGELSGQ